jgi:hypothetical protein
MTVECCAAKLPPLTRYKNELLQEIRVAGFHFTMSQQELEPVHFLKQQCEPHLWRTKIK